MGEKSGLIDTIGDNIDRIDDNDSNDRASIAIYIIDTIADGYADSRLKVLPTYSTGARETKTVCVDFVTARNTTQAPSSSSTYFSHQTLMSRTYKYASSTTEHEQNLRWWDRFSSNSVPFEHSNQTEGKGGGACVHADPTLNKA